MDRRRIWGVLILMVVTAAAAAVTYPETRAEQREAAEYRAFLDTAPVAQAEGDTESPDLRFRVETAGRTEHYISGLVVPEFLQVTDAATGEVLWQDQGWLTQSASWSPDSRFLALAYSTRIQSGLKFVDTETWSEWEFTLPDGSAIPEYVFFPEKWAQWRGSDTLQVTLGRETEKQRICHCALLREDDRLTGSVFEEMAEVLSEDWDFDHDGVPETTELVTVEDPEGAARPAWYELRITRQDGVELWSTTAHWSHPGWTSVFACEIDGEDWLLQYDPEMWQGWGEYTYRLFHPYIISPVGNEPAEQVLRESSVIWDLNFGREGHNFNAAALADFLEEVHSYLDRSILLLSTEDGEVRTGGSGADFRVDMDLWDRFCPYDDGLALQENLENLERCLTAARQAAEIQ
jgi:hypothetical protein